MKNEYTSKIWREYLKFLKVMLNSYPELQDNMKNNSQIEALYFSNILTGDTGSFVAQFYPQWAEIISTNEAIQQAHLQATVVMDLYMKINKRIALGIAEDAEYKLINQIIDAEEKKDYNILLINQKYVGLFVNAAIEALDQSAFERVLEFMSLNLDDVSFLTSVNPLLFETEYQKYSIKLDRTFMLRQIGKLINETQDKIASFDAAAKFLIEAFKLEINIEELVVDIMNSGDPEKFMQVLVDEDIDQVSVYLVDYYNTYNVNGPKLN